MTLPSIIDLLAIGGIGFLTMMFIQYVKDGIPDKLVRVATILAGIGVGFLWYYNPQTGGIPDLVVIIANGVFGAIAADTGYNFLSPTNSPAFTLPGREDKKVIEVKPTV